MQHDCSKLKSTRDLTADDNGAWQPTGKPCTWFKVIMSDNGKVEKLDHKPSVSNTKIYSLSIATMDGIQLQVTLKEWLQLLKVCRFNTVY